MEIRFNPGLEIRSTGDGRTVTGICCPFDSIARIDSYEGKFDEHFVRGSFQRTIAERGSRIKFLAHHDQRSMPLGRAVLLREDTAGLYSEFRVSKTVAGDEALELIRDGSLDGLSVGFTVIRETWSDRRTKRAITEAKLHEVSAVSFPAYELAQITGVRANTPKTITNATATRRLALKPDWA